jgi:hypothetical protein
MEGLLVSDLRSDVVSALRETFMDVVTETAEMPFHKTGVKVPGNAVWERYADAVMYEVSRHYPQPSEAGESPNTTTQDEWRPIETAPRDGSTFLAWKKGHIIETYFDPEDEIWRAWSDEVAIYLNAYPLQDVGTHWMPLPIAPARMRSEL